MIPKIPVRLFKQSTLLEYLKQAPSTIIFNSVKKESQPERRIISSIHLENIEQRLATKESLEDRFGFLSDDAKRMCLAAYCAGASGIALSGYREHAEEIISSFCAYYGQDEYGNLYLFGFRGMDRSQYEVLLAYLHQKASDAHTAQPIPFLKMRCISDLTIFLIYARQGLILKKRDATLLQSTYQLLEKRLHGTRETCTFDNARHDMRNLVHLLLEYSLRRALVHERERDYFCSGSTIEGWLEQGEDFIYEDFIRFTYEYLGGVDPSFYATLFSVLGSRWLPLHFFPKQWYGTLRETFLVLHYIGLCSAIRTRNEIYICKDSGSFGFANEKDTCPVRLLADFSGIIPQESTPQNLFSFSCLGTFEDLDKVYRCNITRESICASMTAGIHPERMVELLTAWRAPDNVIKTVMEWIREYGRVSIVPGSVIVTGDSATTRQLESLIPGNVIQRVPGDALFRICKGREHEVWEVLASAGFDPRMPPQPQQEERYSPGLNFEPERQELSPLFDAAQMGEKQAASIPAGKYSCELKELEINELHHVLDFAMLMNYHVSLEYEGDLNVRRGLYTMRPTRILRDAELGVEGILKRSGIQKSFALKKIRKIGVLTS